MEKLQIRHHLIFVTILVALGATACSGKRGLLSNEDSPGQPVSAFKMSDAKASTQLLTGFYGVEAGAWRWTAGKFAVMLATPQNAAQNGGTLTFNFSVPDITAQRLGTITLSASIGGKTIGSTSYDKPGAAVFMADVPADLLTGNTTRVEFALDKAMPPMTVPGDNRELGLISQKISLESK